MINKETTPRGGLCCPECGNDSAVVDSRAADGNIRRRRECVSCRYRFTTREIIHAEGGDFMVVPREEWSVVIAAFDAIEALNVKIQGKGHTAIRLTKNRLRTFRRHDRRNSSEGVQR